MHKLTMFTKPNSVGGFSMYCYVPSGENIIDVMRNNSLDSYVFIAPEVID